MAGRLLTGKLAAAISAGGIAWVLVLALSGAALAHAELVAADPRPGSVVDTMPSKVTLRFSETVDVLPDAVSVTGPNGQRADRGPARPSGADASVLEVNVEDHGAGTYLVQWRVISADGHPVSGSFAFSVAAPSPTSTGVGTEEGAGLPLLTFARWLHLLALALAVGPAAYAVLRGRWQMRPGSEVRLVHLSFSGSLLLLVSGTVMLVGQVAAVGGSLTSVFQTDLLMAVLTSRWGSLWLGRLVGSIVLALLVTGLMPSAFGGHVRRVWWILHLCIGSVLLALTSMNGHASVTQPVWLSLSADMLHLAAAVVWVGSLISFLVADLPLVWSEREPSKASSVAISLGRLSDISVVAMQIMVATGLYGAWVQVKVPSALVTAFYGRTLLAKMALVAVAVGMGAYHLFVVRPKIEMRADLTKATSRLSRTLALEMSVAVAILAAAGLLTSLPPVSPSQAYPSRQVDRPDITLAENAGPLMVILSVLRDEDHPLRLRLIDMYGNPVSGAQVRVAVRDLQAGAVGGISAFAQELGQGTYWAALTLPSKGRWAFDVAVSTNSSEGVASFVVPWPVGSAQELLKMVDDAMNTLQTLSGDEELTDGRATLYTHYEFQAPSRMHLVTQGVERLERYALGGIRYDKIGSGTWSQEPWPAEGGFRWPFYSFASTAEDVVLLGREQIDGTDCLVLAFRDGPSGAMYRMWVGASDYLIRKYRMIMPGHYMTVRYYGFNAPLTITPPQP